MTLLLATAVAFAIAATGTARAQMAQAYDNKATTKHLVILWNDGDANDAIVETIKEQGEAFYETMARVLEREPDGRKVTVILQGRARGGPRRRTYSYMDREGIIHLYQETSSYQSYLGALAHEMVHVFRYRRRQGAEWFFEEGLAEFVALRVDSSLAGFPWYGFPVEIAAGQWLARDESIPLRTLRDRYPHISRRCKIQSYTLGPSFFDYLGKTYGDDAVYAIAKELTSGELEQYKEHFGKDFDTLAAEWQQYLLDAYNATEGANEMAQRYREGPIRQLDVCDD